MKAQQRITSLLDPNRPLLSVEFFPPKTEEAVARLSESASRLKQFQPDFVSVTYGAGGSTREKSARVCTLMKDQIGLNVMPHFTCVGASREELGQAIDDFHAEGYRNIMALRGDPPKDQTEFQVAPGGFKHASELVAFIRKRQPEICTGVAGYPEKHPEAASFETDLDHLKIKVDAGASFITTQLFFDNQHYYDFVEKTRARGIDLPIIPGLMPALATGQIKRITNMCGSKIPPALESELEKAEADPKAVAEIGSNWAREQLIDLMKNGVPGVHLYALNKAEVALELMKTFRARFA